MNFFERETAQTVFFETFDEAQNFIKKSNPDEYQIAISSLEDVYFALIGEPSSQNGNGGSPHKK